MKELALKNAASTHRIMLTGVILTLGIAGCGGENDKTHESALMSAAEPISTAADITSEKQQLTILAEPDIDELLTKALPNTGSINTFSQQRASADPAPGTRNLSATSSYRLKAPAHRMVAPGSYSMVSSQVRRLYGPGIFTQNALGNTIIGSVSGYDRIVSNRFRATVSGHIASVRLYWQPGRGYSAGSGGKIRLRLLPDNGASQPNLGAAPLASGMFQPGWGATSAGRPIFNEIHLSSRAPISAGRLYHLVMDNVDGAPHQNYISSNNVVTHTSNGRPSRWVSPQDWGTLLGMRRQWSNQAFNWSDLTANGSRNNYYSPILQIKLGNGQSQGVADMEGGSVDPKLIFTATRSKPVRERFTPSSTKRVTAFSVATAATHGGSMRWRLMDGNTELAAGRIWQSSANYRSLQSNAGYRVGGTRWYDVEIPGGKTITLQARRSYDLEFHPEGNSQWRFADHRNGSHHGFSWPAAFTESRAQHRQNGIWKDSYHWNYWQSRNDSNWPVVLHLAP